MQGANLYKVLKDKAFTLVILAASIGLYILADNFEFTAKPGRLGPDFWPKVMLLLIMCMSVIEIIAALFRGGSATCNEEGSPDREEQECAEIKQRYPKLLAIGVAMTVSFVLLVETLGFALTTFLYLAGFMYVGRYRRHAVIWVSSLAGTLLLVLIFVKLVYVSLPSGLPPFDSITYLIYLLLGIS